MLTGLLLTLALAMPLGCGDDGQKTEVGDEVGETGTGDDGQDPPPPKVCKTSCQECADLMKDAYACVAYDKSFEEEEALLTTFECIVCDNDGAWSAVSTCGTQADVQGVYYTDMVAQLVPCGTDGTDGTDGSDDSDDSMESAKCADWLPNRQVHPKRDNEWNIERDFINALVADPSLLIGCDSARVRRFSGVYRVASLDSGDLLGELGFMNDDVIQSVNGYTMSSPFDAALAFFELWPDTLVFTVTVLRPGVGALTFTYNLV